MVRLKRPLLELFLAALVAAFSLGSGGAAEFAQGFCRSGGQCWPFPGPFGATCDGEASAEPCFPPPTPTPTPAPASGWCVAPSGQCWPVPGPFGATCEAPNTPTATECGVPPVVVVPGPTPPPVAEPRSWDPGQRSLCFRGADFLLPPYLVRCSSPLYWSLSTENPDPPADFIFEVTSGASPVARLFAWSDFTPEPADPALQWSGLFLMDTSSSAWTTEDLYLSAVLRYAGACCGRGAARVTAIVVAQAANGFLYEIDLNLRVSGNWGDRDPRPEYVIAPEPFPPADLDAWVILNGPALGLSLDQDRPARLLIPVTELFERVSKDNPDTFPEPPGGWRVGGGWVVGYGVGVELYRDSWAVLDVSEMTLWAGRPGAAQLGGASSRPRVHLGR